MARIDSKFKFNSVIYCQCHTYMFTSLPHSQMPFQGAQRLFDLMVVESILASFNECVLI